METTVVVDRERIGSASSSYPSEGIRSPVQGCSSPEPDTNTHKTANYFAEYRRFSRYPSHSSWHLSDVRMNESAHADAAADNSLAIDDASPDCTIIVQSHARTPSPTLNLPEGNTNLVCTDKNQPVLRRSSAPVVEKKQQKPSSNSEITIPILENEDAITSQLEVSFMTYKRPNIRSTSEGTSGRHCQLTEGKEMVSSAEPSVDTTTAQTVTKPIRQRSDMTDDAWSTIHEPKERPSSSSTPWMHLLASTPSNGSSHTLTQRLQRLKHRLWAKRVYFKTKAQLQLVGRPVAVSTTSRFTGSKVRRGDWRLKMRKNARKRMNKVRKSFRTRKLKSIKRRDAGEMVEFTSRKRGTKQHRGMTEHFFNTLAKRKSLQFALFRSEKEDKIVDTHKRVWSCPADVGC
ncbi:hypothetical protein F5Y03DRAFT_373297 [Xylaria venustula]|nr:hypothetical protein F5Y03DRAFT_373297 [Xylaria venustula]